MIKRFVFYHCGLVHSLQNFDVYLHSEQDHNSSTWSYVVLTISMQNELSYTTNPCSNNELQTVLSWKKQYVS